MARRLALTLVAAGLLLGLVAPAVAASDDFTVVRPDQKYAGKTYGQWSAAWWQWAANISEPNSPVDDPTGKNCAVHQKGPVWFLAGTGQQTTSPHCTIPEGKAILFPVINGECSQVERNGTTDAELRACADGQMDAVTETSASVDGTAIPLGSPADGRFRFASPLFQITFAPNNGFYPDGSVAGTGPSVADGFWVLLRPLGSGRHTIDFHGKAVFGTFVFEITVHYAILVD
jgi:hypothetical protein